ncbi:MULTISPECIES: ATP-binding protein [unclassified Kitasatospora]|uniref:ATP-binding protein n=1 Tax=unclassified Kitasatospora TaxID=2633591 RepID=UPI003822D9C7
MAVFSRTGRHRGAAADVVAVVCQEAHNAALNDFVATWLPHLLRAAELGMPPRVDQAPSVVRRAAAMVLASAGRVRGQISQDAATAVRPVLAQLGRQGSELSAAQQQITDAASLACLYQVDLANALASRFAVRLAVLTGGIWPAPRRQPAQFAEVGQAATSRVADFERVQVLATADLTVVPWAIEPLAAAVAELLDNALLCGGPQAQVVLASSTEPGGGGATWLTVTDNGGPGMDDRTLPAVRQVLESGGRAPAGTRWPGLGLRLVAAAARYLDLKVTVTSVPGQTVASVLLPPALLVPPPATVSHALRQFQ